MCSEAPTVRGQSAGPQLCPATAAVWPAVGGGGGEPRHCGLRGLEQDRGPGHPPGRGAACQGAGGGLQCSGAANS